ncbi:MAG: hypothetical protein E5W75_00770 [Mesorhizobium sp.]|nr:MAG: hypothetical protein E5W75_00770 [Mesorhizobium sp.]
MADLSGILHDLQRVVSYLDVLLETKDDVIESAVFTSSLIAYRRCFTHGARTRMVRSDIEALHENAAQFHDILMANADKFAAHSVSPLEQFKVGVAVRDNQIEAAYTLSMRLASMSEGDIGYWKFLLSKMIEENNRRGRAAEAALVAEARTRPLKDITGANVIKVNLPTIAELFRKRD